MAAKLDWSDWSFGPTKSPVVGAALAGASAWSITMIGHWAGVAPWWMLAAGVTVAAAAAAASKWQHAPPQVLQFRAGCWAGAGLWSSMTLAAAGDPRAQWPIATLAVLTLVTATVGWGLARAEKKLAAEQERKALAGEETDGTKDKLGREWQTRLRAVTRKPVTITHPPAWWNPRTGFTLRGILPADGTTVGDVKAYEGSLASAANLPAGCNVEVIADPDEGRRHFLVRVATVDSLAKAEDLPKNTSPRTVNDGIGIGFHSDRSPAEVNIRYTTGILAGQKGSGKSNQLNVITHELGRCTDALLIGIDTTGEGRYMRPWLAPWAEGRCGRPFFAAAATSDDEAEALTTALIAIINGRTAVYRDWMRQVDDDKLPVSPEVPQIVLLVDEFRALPEPVKDNIVTISDTGRGAAVAPFISVLEATAGYLPRGLLTQSQVRMIMRVSDESQIQHLFDTGMWRQRFDPASMPYEGTGLYTSGGGGVARHKAWRLKPARISDAAVAMSHLRPDLDPASVDLAERAIPGVWHQRWERTLPVMFPDQHGPAPAQDTQPGREVITVQPQRGGDDAAAGMAEAAQEMEAALAAARAAVDEAEAGADTPDLGDDTDELPAVPAEPVATDPRARVRQIVAAHAHTGIGPSAVQQQLAAEGHTTVPQTVITWMRADAEAGWLSQPGGRGTAYFPGPRLQQEVSQ